MLTIQIDDHELETYVRLLAENEGLTPQAYVIQTLKSTAKYCYEPKENEILPLLRQFLLIKTDPTINKKMTLNYVKCNMNRTQRNTIVYALCLLGIADEFLDRDNEGIRKKLLR